MEVSKDVQKLLEDRYLLRTEKTWNDLAERVGGIYPPATDLIKQMKFIPSTPTLMNGNTKGARKGGLSSCFPMGIEDSIDGIFDALKDAAIVTKNSGGVGFNFSKLRSSKEEVSSLDGRKSTGPLPFLDMFNSMLDGIRQGGARRGAGMCMLDINHPDILDFIEAKSDVGGKRFNRFNLSIRVSDAFYKSLEETPDAQMITINVINKKENKLVDRDEKPVSYKQLWNKIVKHAWQSAEPGIFNSDIAYKQCTITNYSQDVLANPCCLIGNTIIQTSLGPMTIKDISNLSDIEKMDLQVISYDIENDKFSFEYINASWLAKKNSELIKLETEDGIFLTMTLDHKLFTMRGWVEAQYLTEDDQIMKYS